MTCMRTLLFVYICDVRSSAQTLGGAGVVVVGFEEVRGFSREGLRWLGFVVFGCWWGGFISFLFLIRKARASLLSVFSCAVDSMSSETSGKRTTLEENPLSYSNG